MEPQLLEPVLEDQPGRFRTVSVPQAFFSPMTIPNTALRLT